MLWRWSAKSTVKELTLRDLSFVFEQDIKMAIYTLERYQIEANLALVACDDYDIDKAHLIETLRQSDIAKKVNDHYVVILFTFVNHEGARSALQKLLARYPQYKLQGSLIGLKKGDDCEMVFNRILQANRCVHADHDINLFDDFDTCTNNTSVAAPV